MKKKVIEFFRNLFAWFRRNDVSVLDTNLPEFKPKKAEVIDIPMSKEYVEELEENEKCAVVCNDCTTEVDFIVAMEASATARKRGINNTMPEALRANALALLHFIIKPLMAATGWTYRITSGYRNEELNAAVGGAPRSLHRFAQALDFVCYDENRNRVPVIMVARKMRDLKLLIRLTILYGTFTHAEHIIGGENNRQISHHSSHVGERLVA